MNNTDRLCMGCMNDNGGEKICPICGYDSSTPADPACLEPHTWIKERYLVGRVYEKSGEGITYVGWDNLNNNVIYIKEYFPAGLCSREENKSVTITEGKEFEFNNGIMQFIEISNKTAQLSALPSVMPVVETLEMNGTAYSIIKAAAGITLREFLLRNGGNLKWEQAKPLFLPLITTLDGMHKAGILHCGISPETVIVGRDGKLHIFGIAIPQIRRATSGFSTQLFPGFAAAEQYSDDYEIGAHTDVYGLAATLFRVLIGNPPMAANERLEHDNMSIPAKFAETIPPYVLSALANALQITPEHRTSDMQALRAALTRSTPETPAVSKETQTPAVQNKKRNRNYTLIAAASTAGILLVIALALVFTVFRDDIFGTKTPNENSSVSAPSVSSYGDVDPTVSDEPTEKLYEVPSFKGMKYSEVVDNVDYKEIFKFSIKGTEASDSVPEGAVISQSVAEKENVKKETTIELVISTGPAEVKMPDLSGKSQIEAYVALLEDGFAKENIEFMEKYDDTKTPQTVIETSVSAGTKVSRFTKIIVFINSYEEPASDLDVYTGKTSSAN